MESCWQLEQTVEGSIRLNCFYLWLQLFSQIWTEFRLLSVVLFTLPHTPVPFTWPSTWHPLVPNPSLSLPHSPTSDPRVCHRHLGFSNKKDWGICQSLICKALWKPTKWHIFSSLALTVYCIKNQKLLQGWETSHLRIFQVMAAQPISSSIRFSWGSFTSTRQYVLGSVEIYSRLPWFHWESLMSDSKWTVNKSQDWSRNEFLSEDVQEQRHSEK